MDHNEHNVGDGPGTGVAMSRRALFGRALMAVGGGGVALFGLTGCPGGGDDDDDDGGEDGDDD